MDPCMQVRCFFGEVWPVLRPSIPIKLAVVFLILVGFAHGQLNPCANFDWDCDHSVSLQEILRFSQLTNYHEFHCDPQGEDGFGLGPGDRSCDAYDADYAVTDWTIDNQEWLNITGLWLALNYHYCPDHPEVGYFCPGLEAPEGEELGRLCSADINTDFKIELSELLRVIQLYNSHGYQCAASTGFDDDGYLAGPGPAHGLGPHSIDYAPTDWVISMRELLRIIQFYNAGGYGGSCNDSEDGFCPRSQ